MRQTLRWALLWLPLATCAITGARFDAAPPPPAGSDAATSARHQEGRSLFIARCQRCHALPAVAAKSAAEWPDEVSSMAKKSGLSTEQTSLISAYLVAVTERR